MTEISPVGSNDVRPPRRRNFPLSTPSAVWKFAQNCHCGIVWLNLRQAKFLPSDSGRVYFSGYLLQVTCRYQQAEFRHGRRWSGACVADSVGSLLRNAVRTSDTSRLDPQFRLTLLVASTSNSMKSGISPSEPAELIVVCK